MIDYISREAAIRDICEWATNLNNPKMLVREDVIGILENIPAADVRPVVRGRWLPTSDANKKRCSRCDVIHLIAQYPHGEINYCPNCGAKMEES